MTGTEAATVAPTGRVCLDFVNTVHWRAAAEPKETLMGPADLAAWARGAGLTGGGAAGEPSGAAPALPDAPRGAFERAVHFRETLYRIFLALIRGHAPDEADLAAVMGMRARAAVDEILVRDGDRFAIRPAPDRDPATLDAVLGAVAVSAVGLLTSADAGRLGQCADDRGCGLLFIDTSKNRSRLWCSMELCGNRAKRRRNYRRHRA